MTFTLHLTNVTLEDIAVATWAALIANGWALYRTQLEIRLMAMKAMGNERDLSSEEIRHLAASAFEVTISNVPPGNPFLDELRRYKEEVILNFDPPEYPRLRLV